MSQTVTKIENKSTLWESRLRFRVGETCTYNNVDWVNITGGNSEPGVGSDWKLKGSSGVVLENAIIEGETEKGATQDVIFQSLAGKVDKDGAKVLSDVNFSSLKDAKLAGIEDNATADQTPAEIVASIETELGVEWKTQRTVEEIQDVIGALLQAGTHTNITVTYDDVNNKIDLAASGTGNTLTPEEVEDIVGGVATQGTGINIFYDDVNNALVVSLSGESFTTAHKTKLDGIAAGATANSTDAQLRDRTTHTGTQAASTIVESATKRFASDTEKAAWNSKEKKRQPKVIPATTQYTLVATDFTDDKLFFTANGGQTISLILNPGVAPINGELQMVSAGDNKLAPSVVEGITAIYPEGTNPKTISKGWLGGIVTDVDTISYNGSLESTVAGGGEANVQPDWAETNNLLDSFIKNKPTIPVIENMIASGETEKGAAQAAIFTALAGKLGGNVMQTIINAACFITVQVAEGLANDYSNLSALVTGKGYEHFLLKRVDGTFVFCSLDSFSNTSFQLADAEGTALRMVKYNSSAPNDFPINIACRIRNRLFLSDIPVGSYHYQVFTVSMNSFTGSTFPTGNFSTFFYRDKPTGSGVTTVDTITAKFYKLKWNSTTGAVAGTEISETPDLLVNVAGDTTAPTISSATVENANPSTLVVVFSEVVTITNVTGLTIAGAATPTLSAPTGSGSNTLSFTLSAPLTNGQTVTLEVAGTNNIIDAASNALVAVSQPITNNVAAAPAAIYEYYGLRKHNPSYAGAAIRVKADGFTTEADIGFDGNGDLDVAALTAFSATARIRITKLYGQYNGTFLSQTTESKMPVIMDAGATINLNGTETMYFSSTTSQLLGDATLTAENGLTALIVAGTTTATASNKGLFGKWGATAEYALMSHHFAAPSQISATSKTSADVQTNSASTSSIPTGQLNLISVVWGSDQYIRLNGTEIKRDAITGVRAGTNKFVLGGYTEAGTTTDSQLRIAELLLYKDEVSPIADETEINSKYTIY